MVTELPKKSKMLSYLLLILVSFYPSISGTNVAVTYDAASSTCTAAVSTCIESNVTYCHSSNESTSRSVAEELLRSSAKGIEAMNQKMNGLIASVFEIKNTTTSNTKSTLANTRAIRELLELMEDLIALHNSSTSSLPTSCQEIKNKEPTSPSGVYALAVNGSKVHLTYVYCHMGELCGSGGGWTRLAYLDMTDSKEACPPGFKLYQSGGVRACGRAFLLEYNHQQNNNKYHLLIYFVASNFCFRVLVGINCLQNTLYLVELILVHVNLSLQKINST